MGVEIAEKIQANLGLASLPGAIQICMGGVEGVLSLKNDFHPRKIGLPPSMIKFPSPHHILEVKDVAHVNDKDDALTGTVEANLKSNDDTNSSEILLSGFRAPLTSETASSQGTTLLNRRRGDSHEQVSIDKAWSRPRWGDDNRLWKPLMTNSFRFSIKDLSMVERNVAFNTLLAVATPDFNKLKKKYFDETKRRWHIASLKGQDVHIGMSSIITMSTCSPLCIYSIAAFQSHG